MKREILFRGKDIVDGQWHHGYFRTGTRPREKGKHFISGHEVIPETVGQFTGFTDAMKRKLFEDDHIENDAVHYTICFSDGTWEAIEIGSGDNINLCDLASDRETFLQGNIHDNPELLTTQS